MKGMAGVIVVNNELRNTAVITQEIKSGEKYLVHFQNEPKFYQVVDLEVIQSWILFADPGEMQTWIRANKTEAPVPTITKEEVSHNGEDKQPDKSIDSVGHAGADSGSGKNEEFEDADLEAGTVPGTPEDHSEGTD